MTDPLEAMLDLEHPVKTAARDWASARLADGETMEQRGIVDKNDWALFAEFGVLGTHVASELGGMGIGAVETALIYEGLGASTADNGLIFAAASHAIAPTRAIAESGSPAQLEQWFPALCDGSTFASFAMSEPSAGSDPWMMETTAEQRADGTWVLNGTKAWCTLGPITDVLVVFAVTDASRGQWGISAFIVPGDTDGLEKGATVEKSGLQSCPFGEVSFVDCHLPADALLGQVGSGAAIFTKIIEHERALLYASQIGAVERVLDLAVQYAKERIQGGTHVGSHQAVAHRLVNVKAAHESARLLLYKSAARIDRNQPVLTESALAKIVTAERAIEAVVDIMKTFGALGITKDLGIERELRDSLAGLAYSGTPDLARNVAAAQMGLNRRSR